MPEMRYRTPPTSAVHSVRGRLLTISLLVLDVKVEVNVVDGDLELAGKILLGSREEGLCGANQTNPPMRAR